MALTKRKCIAATVQGCMETYIEWEIGCVGELSIYLLSGCVYAQD